MRRSQTVLKRYSRPDWYCSLDIILYIKYPSLSVRKIEFENPTVPSTPPPILSHTANIFANKAVRQTPPVVLFFFFFFRAGVRGPVCGLHAEQERGEAVQSLQERLPHGHQRVAAQVPVPARGDRAAHLREPGENAAPKTFSPHLSSVFTSNN